MSLSARGRHEFALRLKTHRAPAERQARDARNTKNRPSRYGGAMFEQAFKNIDDVLWKEAGCTTELDYTEQTSWLLFLKYLDGLEQDKATEAELEGKKYSYILDKPYRWETWAAPKGKDGEIDHNAAMTGDDLRDFVNQKLFPYLHGFKQKAAGPNTIEYKPGEFVVLRFGLVDRLLKVGANRAADHMTVQLVRGPDRNAHGVLRAAPAPNHKLGTGTSTKPDKPHQERFSFVI